MAMITIAEKNFDNNNLENIPLMMIDRLATISQKISHSLLLPSKYLQL